MKGASYLFVLFLGFIIGILWAPRKGSQLREALLDHFVGLAEAGNDVAITAAEKGSELREIAGDSFAKASTHLNQAKVIAAESVSMLNTNLRDIAGTAIKR